MGDIRASLAEFGADPSSLRLLDDEGPELLPYATLMAARRDGHAPLEMVEAVYEWQGAPLVFLIDAGFVGKRWAAATDTASARDARGRALSRRGRAGESPCLSPRPRQEVIATGSTGLGGGGWPEHNGIRETGERASASRYHQSRVDFQRRPETV